MERPVRNDNPSSPRDFRHSLWATGSIIAQYLFMLVSIVALLRFVGLGWFGSALGSLIGTAAYFFFVYAVLRRRR